jgi:hypothetical protein
MTGAYSQESDFRWPSGIDKTAAILRSDPDELSKRHGIAFSSGADSLDDYVSAALRLRSGRLVLLIRYQGEPGLGTSVTIDLADDAAEARMELAESLGLTETEFAWLRPG